MMCRNIFKKFVGAAMITVVLLIVVNASTQTVQRSGNIMLDIISNHGTQYEIRMVSMTHNPLRIRSEHFSLVGLDGRVFRGDAGARMRPEFLEFEREGIYTINFHRAPDMSCINKLVYQNGPHISEKELQTVSSIAQTNRGTFTDSRDEKTYRYVTIGNQTWMAENLNFATPSGSWCYDNNESNCNIYGRLYDWNTAMTVCPAGWHLPSDEEEWGTLINCIGFSSGRKLKMQSGWAEDGSGTDDFGFSALPGGSRWDGSFDDVGHYGLFWTATGGGATYANLRIMDYGVEYVYMNEVSKSNGFSVRCVKD